MAFKCHVLSWVFSVSLKIYRPGIWWNAAAGLIWCSKPRVCYFNPLRSKKECHLTIGCGGNGNEITHPWSQYVFTGQNDSSPWINRKMHVFAGQRDFPVGHSCEAVSACIHTRILSAFGSCSWIQDKNPHPFWSILTDPKSTDEWLKCRHFSIIESFCWAWVLPLWSVVKIRLSTDGCVLALP